MELARRMLGLGYAICEHYQKSGKDLMFWSTPAAPGSVADSAKAIREAFDAVQGYVVEKKIVLPQHARGQALRFDIVSVMAVALYMETMSDSSATLERLAKIMSSTEEDALAAALTFRRTLIGMLVAEIVVYDSAETSEIVVSPSAKRILSENHPEILSVSRHAVGQMIAKRRNAIAQRRSRAPAAAPVAAPRSRTGDGMFPLWTARELADRMRMHVVGQEPVIRLLSTRMVLHLERARMIAAGEEATIPGVAVMLVGPSGTGKSYSTSVLARMASDGGRPFPYFCQDLGLTTEAGYVGGNLEDGLRGLIQSAGGDAGWASYGLAHWDELDTKCGGHGNVGDFRSGVQAGLLRIVEGSSVSLVERAAFCRSDHPVFDTRALAHVMSGAFTGMDGVIKAMAKKSRGIGYAAPEEDKPSFLYVRDALKEFGVLETLLNRLNGLAVLVPPSPELVTRMLTMPNGIVASYQGLLVRMGITVTFTESACQEIAGWACSTKSYARGAKLLVSSAVEGVLMDEAPVVQIRAADIRRIVGSMVAGYDGMPAGGGSPTLSAEQNGDPVEAGFEGGG